MGSTGLTPQNSSSTLSSFSGLDHIADGLFHELFDLGNMCITPAQMAFDHAPHGAGPKNAGSKQRLFRPLHRGRIPTSKASTAVCPTIRSTPRRPASSPRPNGWPRTNAINTTTSVCIPNWVTRPRQSLRPAVWHRFGLEPIPKPPLLAWRVLSYGHAYTQQNSA